MALFAVTQSSSAHEVQPAVADLAISEDQIEIILDWNIEAPVAGLDLEGLADTNLSERAEVYDALRALPPEEMAEAFREAWPGIVGNLTLKAGDADIAPELQGVRVDEIGNIELARISEVTISAPLPADGSAVVFGWDPSLGPLIIRQTGVEGGYSAFLSTGGTSDPIPREGATNQSAWDAFVEYIGVGFDHIVPMGLDHILFVLGLFFLSLRMGSLLWQISAFTLAHTVTLALGALDIIRLPADIVEPLIAASIVYVGIENVLARGLMPWRPVVVFLFGLLHGLGFASVLADFGLGADHFVPKLIGFNVGVEVGQLAVIFAAWLALGAIFARYTWYFARIAAPVSIGISVIALFWVFERTGVIDPEGVFAPFTLLTEGGLPVLATAIVAVGIVAVLTAIEMATISDRIRDVAGFVTSFVLFMAVVATFTSGAYVWTVGLTLVWILALRLQSLGGPEDEQVKRSL